jgi:secretion/DNA translocation related CpaE-like protein
MNRAAKSDRRHRRPVRGSAVVAGSSGVIGFLGGCGGAGASSLAAVVAAVAVGRRASRRSNADSATVPLLIDLDPLGGGLDVALGAEGVAGPRWSGLHAAGGRLDPDQLRDGLPRWREALFLACDGHLPPTADAVRSVIQAGREIGPVVLDLGRSTTPARTAALELLPTLVIIVPAEIRAVTAAASMQAALADDGFTGAARLVVRSDQAVIGSGRMAEALDLPLAGALGNDPGLRSARDRGVDPRRLRRGTRALARELLDWAALCAQPAPPPSAPTSASWAEEAAPLDARMRPGRLELESAGVRR